MKLSKRVLNNIVLLVWYFRGKVLAFSRKNKSIRNLEIGPGYKRIEGFETLNVKFDWHVDYIHNASKPLPFSNNTFDIVYASHILEHIPWYKTEETLKDWLRVVKKGGYLEVWVPDGLKIAQSFVDGEKNKDRNWHNDRWIKFNDGKDVCTWASGRIFSYGDGGGNLCHPNWHRAIFSERFLRETLINLGAKSVIIMQPSQVRGYDHGWINLGIKVTI
ncbi:MAG: methyltransferase domain-containing protein [Methylococcaceae bacterium]